MKFTNLLFTVFLLSCFSYSQSFSNESTSYNWTQEDNDIYFDDDDLPMEHTNNSIGSLRLDILLYRDSNCSLYTGFADSVYFEFPESCSCYNNNKKCWRDFLNAEYFLKFNWTANFKYLYPEFPYQGDLNLSKCIIDAQNTSLSCIPCQDLYFEYNARFYRGTCTTILVFLIIVVIVITALFFYCMTWYVFKCGRNRNEYTSLNEPADNSRKTYRFYTTN